MATQLPLLACTRPAVTDMLPVVCCSTARPLLRQQPLISECGQKLTAKIQVKPEMSLPSARSLFRQVASLRHTFAAVCYPEALMPAMHWQDAGQSLDAMNLRCPVPPKHFWLAHRTAELLLAEPPHCTPCTCLQARNRWWHAPAPLATP